jgi:ABC-2 type transport system permease protein
MAFEADKVYAVWLREVKRYVNSKSRIITSLAMPLLFLGALGGGFSAMIPGFNYGSFLLPGIVAMTVLFSSIMGGVSIIWDREFGFLKEMLASPTKRESLVLGRTLGGATTGVIQGLMILALGIPFTGMPLPPIANLVMAVAVMIVFSCFLVMIGITIASLIQEVETFQLIMNLVIMPMFFLSNAMFPIDKMPSWLQTISMLNPISYAVDALRSLLIGQAQFSIWLDLGVMAIVFVAALAASTYTFSKTSI